MECALVINSEKTEYLVIRNEGKDLQINKQTIRNMAQSKHLGMKITKLEGNHKEISSSLGQARAAVRAMVQAAWAIMMYKNYKICTKSQSRELKHGAKAWETRAKICPKSKMWRWIIAERSVDRVMNTEIRNTMGIDSSIFHTIEIKPLSHDRFLVCLKIKLTF